MKRLVEPAVRAARQGFPLTSFQAYLFTVIAPILSASDGAGKIFAPGRQTCWKRAGPSATKVSRRRLNGLRKTARSLYRRRHGQGDRGQSRDLGGHLTATI